MTKKKKDRTIDSMERRFGGSLVYTAFVFGKWDNDKIDTKASQLCFGDSMSKMGTAE